MKKQLQQAIKFIKSLGWSKEDTKKILMVVIMLLIACFVLNNFLLIKVRIDQERRRGAIPIRGSVSIDGSVGVSGDIDANVSGSVSTF